jgi:hypothetical protein
MTTDSLYTKINHTLPQEVYSAFEAIGEDFEKRNLYIASLRANGWSLQSIADAVGFTRERIRQICEVTTATNRSSYPLPNPPLKPVKEKRVLPEPDPKSIERLLKLQPMAQQVRSHSTKFRKEAEEYSALVYKVYKEEGVSLFRLAKYLGVTHGALRFRMARYGYIKTKNSNSSCYQPILDKNRYVLKS